MYEFVLASFMWSGQYWVTCSHKQFEILHSTDMTYHVPLRCPTSIDESKLIHAGERGGRLTKLTTGLVFKRVSLNVYFAVGMGTFDSFC